MRDGTAKQTAPAEYRIWGKRRREGERASEVQLGFRRRVLANRVDGVKWSEAANRVDEMK